jgi:hypothetical protein
MGKIIEVKPEYSERWSARAYVPLPNPITERLSNGVRSIERLMDLLARLDRKMKQ